MKRFIKKPMVIISFLFFALLVSALQFTPPEIIYKTFIRPAAASNITDLSGITGHVGKEDIKWGTGLDTDTFTVPTYTGGTVMLTKLPSLYANAASIIKGKWYVSAMAGDHGNAALTGSLAWVINTLGADPANIDLPGNQTYSLTTNLAIPETIVLDFQRGAILGGTGNISGSGLKHIQAGSWQIFSTTGTITFPDGSKLESSWFANFETAVNATGTSNTMLNADDASIMSVAVTVPATCAVIIQKGGSIDQAGNALTFAGPVIFQGGTIDNDAALTFNGPLTMSGGTITQTATITINKSFEAGIYNVGFDPSYTVTFAMGAVKEVYSQWWGAKGDGTTDDTAAFTATFATSNAGTYPIPVKLVNGNYLITDTLTVTSGMIIEGSNKSIYSNSQTGIDDKPACLITFAPTASKDLFSIHEITPATGNYASNIRIADLAIKGNSTGGVTDSRYALNLDMVAHSTFENLAISRFVKGHYATQAMTNRFTNVYIGYCVEDCIYYEIGGNWSTSDVWNECIFRQTPSAGTITKGFNITFDSCLWESLGVGLIIYRECSEIVLINPYVENVPTVDEGTVWNVGNYGTTTFAGNNFSVYGGVSIGRIATYGGKTGTWMNVNYISGVRVIGGHIQNYTIGLASNDVDNTPEDSVYISGPSFDDVDVPFYDLAGKMWGSYPTGGLDGTIAPELAFNSLIMGGHNIQYGATAPAAGTWGIGDQIWKTAPAGAASPGWICTESGTFSAATDSTGDTDGSTAVITGMTDTSDFVLGQYVDVSAGFPTTGPYKIIKLTTTTMTIDTASNSAQSNITVDTSDPVWKAMADLGA